MKAKKLTTPLIILFVLMLSAFGAYAIGKAITQSQEPHYQFVTSYQTYPDPQPAPTTVDSIVEVAGHITAFDIDSTSERIAIATSKNIQIYNLKTLAQVYTLPMLADVYQIQFSPDGKRLAISASEFETMNNRIVHILVYDTTSWDAIYDVKSGGSDWLEPSALAWHPDSNRLALVQPFYVLSVIDVSTGEALETQSDEIFFPRTFAWSPDGKRLISNGDWGQTLRRWNIETNQTVRLFDKKVGGAQNIVWSPNGEQIAVGYYGGDVCLWNASNNQCEGMIHAHFNSVDGLDWSPNGQQIATASGAIRVWDAKTGELQNGFGFYDGLIYSNLQWINDTTIATLESSYTLNIRSAIRLWDAKTSAVKLTFQGWNDVKSINSDGIALHLDDIQISKDQTILQVSLRMNEPNTNIAGQWNITLTDSDGLAYPLTDITSPDSDQAQTHIYRTVPILEGKRLILNLVGLPDPSLLPILRDIPNAPIALVVDPNLLTENKPLVLNQDVDADGYIIKLKSITKISSTSLAFEFYTDGFYTGAMLQSPLASGAESKPADGNTFTSLLTFESIPSEPFEVNIWRISYNTFGAWQLVFDATKSMNADLPSLETSDILTPYPLPTYTTQDPIFLEVKTLLDKFNASVLQNEAGWVHVVNEITTESFNSGQSYPPTYYQEEIWYEVDAQGWVTRSLTTHWGKDKNILQQSVSVGTHNLNLTYGEANEFPTYQLSFTSFLTDLDNAFQNGSEVTSEQTTCENGSDCLLVTIKDTIILRAWFNLQTGQEVKFQISQKTADGTEEILNTYNFLTVEKTSPPPQEVLDIFEKVLFQNP